VANVDNPSDTSGRLIAASKVNGTSVYNPAGEKLGSVYDVMIDKISGKSEYAILSFGGFLGLGDNYYPLPWRELKYDTGQGGFVVNMDRSKLEGAPSYGPNETGTWENEAWGRRLEDYYRDPATDATAIRP
jgi:sporulation protein YlmC with PRC-barrel domain